MTELTNTHTHTYAHTHTHTHTGREVSRGKENRRTISGHSEQAVKKTKNRDLEMITWLDISTLVFTHRRPGVGVGGGVGGGEC